MSDEVQCWHIEPGTPCDWDICRQPERLAAGDRGTDPGTQSLPTPSLDRLRGRERPPMTTYDELTPDALFLLENLSELDIVQDCADRGAKIAELREELVQQRGRADNAEARLDLARQALVADGYFTRAEVGDEGSPDIAPRITELAVHLRAELAALYEGEEPYDDDRLIPTPGQWIWRWNRATPAERLDVVQLIKTLGGQRDRVEALARSWADAPPLLPGQALADLRNAMSDNPQPTVSQAVQAGEHLIRVSGDRVPSPGERAAIGALIDANEAASKADQEPTP